MTSVRTVIRDAVVTELTNRKAAEACLQPEYDVRVRWITEQETKSRNTYCVVVTDETRESGTLAEDIYQLTIVLVLYAHDATDPRPAMDAMIEDAIQAMASVAGAIRPICWRLTMQSIQTDEGTTQAGPWAQAVLRWSGTHSRVAVVD